MSTVNDQHMKNTNASTIEKCPQFFFVFYPTEGCRYKTVGKRESPRIIQRKKKKRFNSESGPELGATIWETWV